MCSSDLGSMAMRAVHTAPCQATCGAAALTMTPGVSGMKSSGRPCHAAGRPSTRTSSTSPFTAADAAAPVRLSAAEIRSRLTDREFELFTVLGEGLANKEIGKRFGISTRTVETHRKSISKKLGCSGAALARLAAIHHQIGGGPDLGQTPTVDASAAAGE